jgi:hypothetical protein
MREITDMKELLAEIEACLCSKLLADNPMIGKDEIIEIRKSIIQCLKFNNKPLIAVTVRPEFYNLNP